MDGWMKAKLEAIMRKFHSFFINSLFTLHLVNFIQCRFLKFYKAELKSEDRFVLRRVRTFRRYVFVDFTTVLMSFVSPLPIVLSITPILSLHKDRLGGVRQLCLYTSAIGHGEA